MPDFTMCNDHTCVIRRHCYRYRAMPNTFSQRFTNFQGGIVGCNSFVHIRKDDNVRSTNIADALVKREDNHDAY